MLTFHAIVFAPSQQRNPMLEPQVTAAIIAGGVMVTGFVVQGLLITRYIDKKRTQDAGALERIKSELSTEATKKLEEYKLDLAEQYNRRQGRRTSLIMLVNMSSDCREAAKELCKFSNGETGEERVRTVTHALHRMSPFFELLAKEDPTSSLKREDRGEAKIIQQQLVKMLLLMDLDRKEPEYWVALDEAYNTVAASVRAFHEYFKELFPD
jgi:hypothetical protein